MREKDINPGPVMLDLGGLHLTVEDRERLMHPACGGVILFKRNFEDIDQLCELTRSIRELRQPGLLIAVDQEGGRVQRFTGDFLSLPAPRILGEIYDRDPAKALRLSRQTGWAMASECLAAGVDFSFAPVLDIDYGSSGVIGDRAFHSDPKIIIELAGAFVSGMHEAGMAAVIKHFPGHGHVKADSHLDIAIDERDYATIEKNDLQPFRELVARGVEGVMPAHVIYPLCDEQPAGFSPFWLKETLRQKLGFNGVIFSDDLSMQAAAARGSPAERAKSALNAGCDMLLVCNNPEAADEVLAAVAERPKLPDVTLRLDQMRQRQSVDWVKLHASVEWSRRTAPWA